VTARQAAAVLVFWLKPFDEAVSLPQGFDIAGYLTGFSLLPFFNSLA
jgi:hypothetical protein